MKLQNVKEHMKGKKVNCNGTIYEIGADGTVETKSEADAKRLLAGPDWRVWGPPKGESQKVPQKAPKPSPKPTSPKGPAKALETAKEAPEPAPEPVAEEKTAPEAVDEPEEAPETGGEDEEWPDPDMTMKKEYLQEMAQAYEVEGWEDMTKQQLVDAIMDKMYE